jgi:hypothetical protein
MITVEKLEHHIRHLQEKHDEMGERIKPETPDYLVRVFKKEKLQYKDEIESCRRKIKELREQHEVLDDSISR